MLKNPKLFSFAGALLATAAVSSCEPVPPQQQGPVGVLVAALEVGGGSHDVQSVRIDIVGAAASCEDTPIASKTLTLDAAKGARTVTSGLFVLRAGPYKVCATPLAGEGPSADCAQTSGPVTVVAEQSRDVLLVSQCRGGANGGLDVTVALNDPPVITDAQVAPSKFLGACQNAALSITASDPDGQPLTYAWAITSGPTGAQVKGAGATASFVSIAQGDFTIGVTVTDPHGAKAALSFPLQVSGGTCETAPEVQAIIAASCSPCHTARASGGLSMATAAASFANLVNTNSAGCSPKVRVVPGAPEQSYIIAKLRGKPDICGLPMPRNLPPLPEEQIQTIEAWIAGLPH